MTRINTKFLQILRLPNNYTVTVFKNTEDSNWSLDPGLSRLSHNHNILIIFLLTLFLQTINETACKSLLRMPTIFSNALPLNNIVPISRYIRVRLDAEHVHILILQRFTADTYNEKDNLGWRTKLIILSKGYENLNIAAKSNPGKCGGGERKQAWA